MKDFLLRAVRDVVDEFFNNPDIAGKSPQLCDLRESGAIEQDSSIIFNNEGHFQAYLYDWLKEHLPDHEGCSNAKVYIEYFVPIHSFDYKDNEVKKTSYEWKQSDRIYIDLVVECNGCYVPIELKYKTETLVDQNYTRFGETICSAVTSDQIATNMGYYDCWQDVRRLELLAERFPKIVGGLFVFLSNSHHYIYAPAREDCKSRNFSWQERTEAEDTNPKEWPEGYDHGENRPNMTFTKGYSVSWVPKPGQRKEHDPNVFRHCIIEIDGNAVRASIQPAKMWVTQSQCK